MPQTADEIRNAIGGRGHYRTSIRSWDCVALLRLDDPTLVHLARLAADGVRLRQSVSMMAEQLPFHVSRYQLKLFLLCFFPERSAFKGPPGRHVIDPGPAECHVAYVMRTQGLNRQRAIAFIRDPAVAERAA